MDEIIEQIHDAIEGPSETSDLEDQRIGYLDEGSRVVVIYDPQSHNGGTAIKFPTADRPADYFGTLS